MKKELKLCNKEYLEDSSSFCVSAHKLPCIALVTLTQCKGFKEVFLDDPCVDCPFLGLGVRAKARPFAPIPPEGGGGTA